MSGPVSAALSASLNDRRVRLHQRACVAMRVLRLHRPLARSRSSSSPPTWPPAIRGSPSASACSGIQFARASRMTCRTSNAFCAGLIPVSHSGKWSSRRRCMEGPHSRRGRACWPVGFQHEQFSLFREEGPHWNRLIHLEGTCRAGGREPRVQLCWEMSFQMSFVCLAPQTAPKPDGAQRRWPNRQQRRLISAGPE